MAEEPERQSEAEPPALPPRPPPRPRQPAPPPTPPPPPRALQHSCWLRKYVFLCTACGGLAVLLGTLFLTVYFMLRSYTSSLDYFETVPTYVPATMLIVTGLIVMCLAARKNRYGYLIKLCGACCMTCAVLCVVVTISTTVVHMNRLQSLRECVYTQKTQTCTCYSVVLEPVNNDQSEEGVRYVFDATPDCEVIHGALYSCLRAMFGLSVIGILICIFSCMLVYQLLSHEKKKMYWEQLEMRCRYLYHRQRAPHHCGCCEECRYPPPHELFPWEVVDDRFWTPGRIGNLYSPNPGQDGNTVSQRPSSGWSWRRLPWNRNSAPQTVRESNSHNYRNTTSSPDSQYGFSSRPDPESYNRRDQPNSSVSSIQVEGYCQRYYMWGPPPPYSNHSSPACREPIFSLLPHQNASSPSRGHHHHHHHCQIQRHRLAQDPRCFEELSAVASAEGMINSNDAGKNVAAENYLETNAETAISGDGTSEINSNLSSSKDRVSNTLPARRTKKRTDISSVKSVSNIPFSFDQQQKNMKVPQDNLSTISNSSALVRTNVQLLFEPECVKNPENFPNAKHNLKKICSESEEIDNRYTQTLSSVPISSRNDDVEGSATVHYRPRHQDKANSAVEELERVQRNKNEPTESEVYFADVSSCCNVSVRNDGQDSSLYDEVSNPQKHRLTTIGLRERTVGYPMSGHVHKLQDAFPEKNRKLNVQAEIIPQNNLTVETCDFRQSSGEHENGNRYLLRICDEGTTVSCHSSSDKELTTNYFSQQRPHSTNNQNTIAHLHGKAATDQQSPLAENIEEVSHIGRSFLDLGNRKPVCNNIIDMAKDSSERNLSHSSGYPVNENNDSSLPSPMSSISTTSPNNLSAEPMGSCEIFYHPENNGTREVVSDSTSASTATRKDIFNNYPTAQKTLYEQDTNVQKNKFLSQQQRNNILNLGCENTDRLPLHRNEQLFLAPDAQYETISQSSQVNIPQSYVCNVHPSNFTISQDGFNGNISTHAALRTNVMHHSVVHDSSVQHGHVCLNLPLHNSNTGDKQQTLKNINVSESPYQAATSTEEEESESHNRQSNCYSDATMDSGCHSGSEFPSNRRGGKIVSRTVPDIKDAGVTVVRSVNV